MIKPYRSLIVLIAMLVGIPLSGYAQKDDSLGLHLINNHTQTLTFIIETNPDVMLHFPERFGVSNGYTMDGHIYDLQKESFVSVYDQNQNKAFFGVSALNGKTHIELYGNNGIAASVAKNSIAFCAPDYFKQHNNQCM